MRDFFAFRTMITGSVIQVVFALGLIAIAIGAIGAIANDQAPAGLLILVFGLLYWRILCELLIVVFRMNSSLTAIRANTAGLAPAPSVPVAPEDMRMEEPELTASGAQAVSAGGRDAAVGATAVTMASETALPAAGWYDDSERPGHKRWWDGTAWGMRDDEHASRASGSPRADAEKEPADTATAVGPISEEPPAVASSSTEPTSPSAPARFCENCGAERSPGGTFCTSCGHAD